MSQILPPATADTVAAARASYARCLATAGFLEDFYRDFFRRCPQAEPLFARTNFSRQVRLLQHAIGLLLSYPGQAGRTPQLLERVAERHSRRDLDIAPELYEPFITSLVETVGRHDPEFTPELGAAWRASLAPGVAYMQSRY